MAQNAANIQGGHPHRRSSAEQTLAPLTPASQPALTLLFMHPGESREIDDEIFS